MCLPADCLAEACCGICEWPGHKARQSTPDSPQSLAANAGTGPGTMASERDLSLKGCVATTATPLNPTGVIRLGQQRLPARSDSGGWIDAGLRVTIVGQDAVGVRVRECPADGDQNVPTGD